MYNRVTSADFKKDFGKTMETAMRDSIIVTRHGRDIVTMFSSQAVKKAQEELLGEYFLDKVQQGEIDFFEALIEERKIMESVYAARLDHIEGHTQTASPEFLTQLKRKAQQSASEK